MSRETRARWPSALADHGFAWPTGLAVRAIHRPAALCYICEGERVLLLRRNRPPFAERWTVPGGKIRPGRKPVDAVVREVWEETGLVIERPTLRMMVLESGTEPLLHWLLFIFRAESPAGSLQASDEGPVAWVPVSELRRVGMVDVDLHLARFVLGAGEAYWADIELDTEGRAHRLRLHPLERLGEEGGI